MARSLPKSENPLRDLPTRSPTCSTKDCGLKANWVPHFKVWASPIKDTPPMECEAGVQFCNKCRKKVQKASMEGLKQMFLESATKLATDLGRALPDERTAEVDFIPINEAAIRP